MDLGKHIQQLVDRNPFWENQPLARQLPELFEIAIQDSQIRGDHAFLKTLLVLLCLRTYIAHGVYALLPLRALVGHVFARCPNARETFDKALQKSCLRLHLALREVT